MDPEIAIIGRSYISSPFLILAMACRLFVTKLQINPLLLVRYGSDFKCLNIQNRTWDWYHDHSGKYCLRMNARTSLMVESTLVRVMAWCRQATSHYANQGWPISLSPYYCTTLQCRSLKLSTDTHEFDVNNNIISIHVPKYLVCPQNRHFVQSSMCSLCFVDCELLYI